MNEGDDGDCNGEDEDRKGSRNTKGTLFAEGLHDVFEEMIDEGMSFVF